MQAPTYTTQAYVSQPRPVAASSSRDYYSGSNEYVPQPQPVTASSSGNFYPGSHYPGSYNERPVSNPRSSTSSIRSIELAESTLERIRTSRSIQSLARQISRDLGELDGTLDDLRAFFRNTDPRGYKKRAPWPQGMESAYSRYKRLGDEFPLANDAFDAARAEDPKNATPEQHVERARLALEWGSLALRDLDFAWDIGAGDWGLSLRRRVVLWFLD
ncbi:hypothetical protein FALBO_4509 [Fusarium albosuccineum]|uniref:Uncharacterized protein n=1 Tax=Fusarium albosuccineum TaxID=1237068 RepID=A0A8H4LIM1_9HYPO|nr:hypothetical protein FALBO_4509 [Fusarium albosuccineum]